MVVVNTAPDGEYHVPFCPEPSIALTAYPLPQYSTDGTCYLDCTLSAAVVPC